jgi:hypothetical protein
MQPMRPAKNFLHRWRISAEWDVLQRQAGLQRQQGSG